MNRDSQNSFYDPYITKGCKETNRYNNDPNNQGISLLVSHMALELDAGQTAISAIY